MFYAVDSIMIVLCLVRNDENKDDQSNQWIFSWNEIIYYGKIYKICKQFMPNPGKLSTDRPEWVEGIISCVVMFLYHSWLSI